MRAAKKGFEGRCCIYTAARACSSVVLVLPTQLRTALNLIRVDVFVGGL